MPASTVFFIDRYSTPDRGARKVMKIGRKKK